jgi:HD-like signal output (HDOD) protein
LELSANPHDLQEILQALGSLKARVDSLASPPAEQAGGGAERPAGERCHDPLALVRAGLSELNSLTKPAEFPEFFGRVASRGGLRMLFLKRWSSGLQDFLERNVKLPAEAKSRRSDGRAPIPSHGDDIFAACGQEAQVYAGPVPLKHFPLDLTLLLGRGSRDRRIIIVPLPAKDHWNSFVYLDADRGNEAALVAVELLAHHAIDRLRLLQRGETFREGRVAAIMKLELERRRQRTVARRASIEPDDFAADDLTPDQTDGMDAPTSGEDPETGANAKVAAAPRVGEATVVPTPKVPVPTGAPVGASSGSPDMPASVRRAYEAQLAADTIVTAWEEAVLGSGGDRAPAAPVFQAEDYPVGEPMAAEDILHRAGELPALPRAAVHILSVIDDPRTTATSLEKAVAMDQALTAKILRIANSPFYGAAREIRTVSEAIVRLGFVTIRNWTLVTATKSMFLAPGAGMLYQKIWRQSVLSAMAAQLVSQTVRRCEPDTAFLGGLMQNIGQLVLARSQPELFQQVVVLSADEGLPYNVVEQELLGFDHGDLGALLIKEWNLNEELEQAVRWHHRLDHPAAQNVTLAATIALGEEIAACTGSHPEDLDLRWEKSRAAARLELPAEVFSRLQALAKDLSVDPGLFG